MSLDSAKMVLRNRGWIAVPVKGGYNVYNKENKKEASCVNGYEVVRIAKKLLERPAQKVIKPSYPDEILAEMRATWAPGTKVVNVITGETITV